MTPFLISFLIFCQHHAGGTTLIKQKNIQEEKSILFSKARFNGCLQLWELGSKKHLRNFAKNSIPTRLSSPLENCVKAGCFWSVKAFLVVQSTE